MVSQDMMEMGPAMAYGLSKCKIMFLNHKHVVLHEVKVYPHFELPNKIGCVCRLMQRPVCLSPISKKVIP
jgi:hypothetical protein